MNAWDAAGRKWEIEDLVPRAADCDRDSSAVLDMDAPTLLLDSDMPGRINAELARLGFDQIADVAGNEPVFARLIFESLAARYASAIANLEDNLGRKLDRIHMIGGATRNKLLIKLTEQRTGLPVEIGECESATVGNFAIQLAASDSGGAAITPEAIREYAKRLVGCS
jgi:rhamnulokinase